MTEYNETFLRQTSLSKISVVHRNLLSQPVRHVVAELYNTNGDALLFLRTFKWHIPLNTKHFSAGCLIKFRVVQACSSLANIPKSDT